MADAQTDAPAMWRGTFARLRQDAHRLRRYQLGKFGYVPLTWFLDPGWVCVSLHRFSHLLWEFGWTRGARLLMQFNSLITGADIQPASDLAGGLLIPSPCGVNISAKAGANLAVLSLGGIGGSVRDTDVGAGIGLPLVGRDVTVNWFTGVQGSITVGDGVVFGPSVGAVVSVATGKHMSLRLPPREVDRDMDQPRSPAPLRPTLLPCGHAAWSQIRADLRADVERYLDELSAYAPPGARPPPRLSAILTNPLLALRVYRISHWLHLNGWRRCAMFACQTNILLHKLTIPPTACLGGGVLMPHLGGTVFHGRTGDRLTLYAGSLCTCHEGALTAVPETAPLLGDNVLVAGHAGAFGPITIGNDAQFGPKAQLMDDLDAGSQVWDPLARGSAHTPDEIPATAPRFVPAPPVRSLTADHPWRETRRRLRRDRERLAGAPRFPAMTCVWLYRLSHAFHVIGRRRLARWTWLLNLYFTGADISPCCEIGAGLLIPHPAGVALHCRAGDDLSVGAIAGITAALDENDQPVSLDRAPLLGDRVHLTHHAGVFGPVTVGDDVLVQPGCVATVSVPARIALLPRKLRIRRRETVERFRSRASGKSDGPIVGDAQLP
jgi:serine O-acetyltransferase